MALRRDTRTFQVDRRSGIEHPKSQVRLLASGNFECGRPPVGRPIRLHGRSVRDPAVGAQPLVVPTKRT